MNVRPRRALALLALAPAFVACAPAAAAAPRNAGVSERKVSFSVVNNNRTDSPGETDGKTYTIRGVIVGPRGTFREAIKGRPLSPTVYLHGLGYAGYFWHLTDFPKYDYAARMADLGHVSVVVDRLGYGRSGKPNGMFDSYGGQATVAHQIVQALRSGDYRFGGKASAPEPRVQSVALAGHSASVFVAQLEAYTFRDVDALLLMSLGDLGASPLALTSFASTQGVCFGGGENSDGETGAAGYAYFGQTDADFRAAHLFDVAPRVADRVTAMRTRDPCGESGTALQAILTDTLETNSITAPTRLLVGKNDALFPPPTGTSQQFYYLANSNFSETELDGTGHALTLGRTAPQVRATASDWLSNHGF